MSHTLHNADFLKHVFDEARTHSAWQNKPVDPAVLKQLFGHLKWGATSANCLPLRVRFVTSAAAKTSLLSAMSEGNVEKTKTAPVNAILAFDEQFYDHLPKLFPHTDARSWFVNDPENARKVALTNAAIQVGYFIVAARALGLDCGPMAGFDAKKMDELFFKDNLSYKSFVVCNLGYGDHSQLYPRLPRFVFDDVCQII